MVRYIRTLTIQNKVFIREVLDKFSGSTPKTLAGDNSLVKDRAIRRLIGDSLNYPRQNAFTFHFVAMGYVSRFSVELLQSELNYLTEQTGLLKEDSVLVELLIPEDELFILTSPDSEQVTASEYFALYRKRYVEAVTCGIKAEWIQTVYSINLNTLTFTGTSYSSIPTSLPHEFSLTNTPSVSYNLGATFEEKSNILHLMRGDVCLATCTINNSSGTKTLSNFKYATQHSTLNKLAHMDLVNYLLNSCPNDTVKIYCLPQETPYQFMRDSDLKLLNEIKDGDVYLVYGRREQVHC